MEVTTTQAPASGGATGPATTGKAVAGQAFTQAINGAMQNGSVPAAQAQPPGNQAQADSASSAAAGLAALLLATAPAVAAAPVMGEQPDLAAAAPGAAAGTTVDAAAAAVATVLPESDGQNQLMAQVDQILDSLLGEDQPVDAAPSLEDWQQAASELSALLALLGIKPPDLAQLHDVPQEELSAGDAITAVKKETAEMLLALQQQLPAAAGKAAGQINGLEWTQMQMSKLQSLLEPRPEAKHPAAVGSAALNESRFTVQGSSQMATSSSMLAKLDAAAAHIRAGLASSATTAQETAPGEAELQPVAGESELPGFNYLSSSAAAANQAPSEPESIVKVPVHRFAQEMTGMILQKMDVTSASGMTEARLVLTPDHLGQVDVKLQIQNGQLTALFMADTPQAREALENQLGQLRLSLQNSGFQVDRLDVSTPSQLQTTLSFGQQGQGSRSGEQQSSPSGRVAEESAATEAEQGRSAIRELGYGRAINETA